MSEQVVDEHDWELLTTSASGHWVCRRCRVSGFGGPHDGGGYFPGRGEPPEFFFCPNKTKVIVFEDGKAVSVGWVKDGEGQRI